MRSLKLRVILLCVATVLTLGLSHTAAQACVNIITGENAYGKYDCRLSAACEGWCDYDCTCSDTYHGMTCNDVLIEAGFILGGKKCIN